MKISQKLNVKPPYNSRALLGRWPKEWKSGAQTDIFSLMFLAVVFMTATHEPAHSLIKGSVSTQRPSAGEWLTKCSMDICLHVIQPYRGRDRDMRHSTRESWNHVYRVTQILCGLLMWATQTSYSRRRREESWGCHKQGTGQGGQYSMMRKSSTVLHNAAKTFTPWYNVLSVG